MKRTAAVAALLASVVLVYFLAARPASDVPEEGGAPKKAPALSGPTLAGKTLSLSSLSGKVVLVDFWATWCDPCREELPGLVRLRDKLAPKGFEILGVSMDEEGAEAVQKFTAKRPISYPVVLNGGERPPQGWFVPGLPTAYLVGKDGTVLKRWLGEKDLDELERDVDAALELK